MRLISMLICRYPRFRGISRIAQAVGLLFFMIGRLTALDPSHAVSQYGHAAWTRADSQLPGRVLALTQTLDGTMWVGTEFGLFRFDGLTFVPWNPQGEQLPIASVTALASAPDGGLWIGTRNGVFYSREKTFQHVRTSEGMQRPGVSAILVDRAGTVWVGTAGFHSGGLCQVNATRSKCAPVDALADESIFSLFEDRGGNVWAGGTKGLYVWKSSSMQKYAAYAASGISGIAQAFDGSIVWTDASNGLQWFVNGKIMRYPAGLRAEAHPRILLSDHEGSLWIGTMGQALMHVHQGRTDQYTRADGLSGDTVFGFFEDRERNVWVATERGLDRFRDFPVVTFSKREGLSEDIAGSVFAAGSGGVWIGTTNGLNLVQDGRISVYDKHQGLASNSIGSLFEDHKGTLWVDSALGLAYGRAGRFRQLDSTQGQKITSVAAIVEDAKGDLWVSDLKRGIIRIGGSQVKDVLPWSFFKHKKASALDVDRTHGGILIGFEEGEVALYQEGRPIRWYTVAEGLGRGEITDIQTDRNGATWIATEGGLSCLRNGNISTLSTKSGMPCDHIHAIIEDDEGTIWLNSACGLLRLLRQDLLAWLGNPRINISSRVYDGADGMHVRSTTDGYSRRAAKSKDGRLWFPVFDGVAVVDPRHLPHNSIAPPVTIERVAADGKTYSVQSEVRLPAGTKELRIDYTAFSFVDPNRVRFRYKLDGHDTGWNDVNGRRQAFFSNLAPRHYRLRVMASNNDGVWNEVGATLDFLIQPAFYQTNWFRLSCVAAFFVLLWLLYRLRLQQVKAKLNLLFNERFNERTRIARDLHDTLLQNISGFALQLEGLSKIVTEPEAAKEWLRELRRDAEGWLHDARESVSDLRPQNSESDDFLADVRDLGERIVTSKSIKFRATATGDHWMIPSRLHDPLLRIVQEALRNAVRHACATEINVDLSCLDRDKVRIRICDNGSGFDLETAIRKPRHWGLANMREHAEIAGATFQVVTSPGRGTEVEITVRISS